MLEGLMAFPANCHVTQIGNLNPECGEDAYISVCVPVAIETTTFSIC